LVHGHVRGWPADDEQRRQWQNPHAILAALGLKAGMVFVDIGCAQGFFALPAASIVGVSGKVYGVDVDELAIGQLESAAGSKGLKNVYVESGKAEESVLCDHCADIVFMGNVLHDFDDPVKVLDNARLMIKPTGELIDLDWKKEWMPIGPPFDIRFTEEKATSLIESAGFSVEQVKDLAPYHYLIVARPV
jgi:ubiquinone/menaquinone biosynthesis C-methylase UbiE